MRGQAFEKHELPPYRLERGTSLAVRRWLRNQLVGLRLSREWVRVKARALIARKARS